VWCFGRGFGFDMIGRWMASAFYGAGVNVVIDVYIMGIWSCLGDWRGEVQDTLILIMIFLFSATPSTSQA